MFIKKAIQQILLLPFKLFFSIKQNNLIELGDVNLVLVIWTSISFGTLLSSRSFFLALKKKYPSAKIKLIVNADVKRKLNKSKLTFTTFFNEAISKSEFKQLRKVLRKKNDISIVPIISEFRLTDHILLRLAKTRARIGVEEFNNIKNPYSFLFDRRTNINFTNSPDVHVSQILIEQLKPFGDFGEHENFYLRFNINEERSIRNLKSELGFKNGNKIILVNLFTEQRQKRISLDKIIELVNQLYSFGEYQFCFIDGKRKLNFKIINKHILGDLIFIYKDDLRNLLNLLNFSSLAITCDSEFMHIAGVVGVPQISIFGPSNPFNLAPIGPKKIFIRKSDLIDDIGVEDIFTECKKLLNIDN